MNLKALGRDIPDWANNWDLDREFVVYEVLICIAKLFDLSADIVCPGANNHLTRGLQV